MGSTLIEIKILRDYSYPYNPGKSLDFSTRGTD